MMIPRGQSEAQVEDGGKKCNGQAENDKWTNKMMLDINR